MLFLPLVECPEYCSDAKGSPEVSFVCPVCNGRGRIAVWALSGLKRDDLTEQQKANEGKEISGIEFVGFSDGQIVEGQRVFGLKRGDRFTQRRFNNAANRIFKLNSFMGTRVMSIVDPASSNKMIVRITPGPRTPRVTSGEPPEEPKVPEEKK